MIIDGHSRIFPPFDSAGGFDSVGQKMKFVQRQFGGHHLPIWRVRDRAPADRSTLLDPATYELNDVEWTSETGRLSWIHDGEGYTNQYMPPMLDNQECTPELLIREMDYIGVDVGVLHPAPIFGIVNDYNLDAVQRFPDRFVALFNIPEATVLNDQSAAIAEIERLVGSGVKCGVQFFSRWYHGTGIDEPWDGEAMMPYWDAVAALDVPVYFTLYNGGKRAREFQASQRETYLDEHRTLTRWMGKYPDTTVTITHGLPWLTFLEDGDRFAFPDETWEVFDSPKCHLQMMVPIMMGIHWETPWKESEETIAECVDRIGADRLMWGTDMPLSSRYCTYKQALDQYRLHCDFLNDDQRADILGGTAARLFGLR